MGEERDTDGFKIPIVREGLKYVIKIPPTAQCLVCEALENPEAEILRTDIPWLCPECKRKLRRMLYQEGDE